MAELVNAFINASISGGVIILIWLLFYPISRRIFNASWHYAVLKIAMVFMLLPLRFLLPIFKTFFESVFKKPLLIESAEHAMASEQTFIPTGMTANPPIQKLLFNLSFPQACSNFIAENILYFLAIWIFVGIIMILKYVYKSSKLKQNFFKISKICTDAEIQKIFLSCKQRLCLRKKIVLRTSEYIANPLVIGALKPTIIFPETEMSSDEKRLAVTHELTHIKNGDLWYKLFAFAISVLHWFNPFAYLLREKVYDIAEMVCDESMTESMSIDERKLYGGLILKVASDVLASKTIIYSTFSTSKQNIERRLKNMMNFKKSKKSVVVISVLLALIFIVTGTIYTFAAQDVISLPIEKAITYEIEDTKISFNEINGVSFYVADINLKSDEEIIDEQIAGSTEAVLISEEDINSINTGIFATYTPTNSKFGGFQLFSRTYNISWSIPANSYSVSANSYDLAVGATINIYITWTPTSASGTSVGVFNHDTSTYSWFTLSNNPGSGIITIGTAGVYSIAIKNTSSQTINTSGSSYTV